MTVVSGVDTAPRCRRALRMRARWLLLAAGLVACSGGESAGPVRTALKASEVAQRELRSAGLDEHVVEARREGATWVVVTRWRETSAAGHLVTIDAATGQAKVERYRSVELGRPR